MRKLFDIHPGLISESALQRIYLDLAEDYLAHQIEPTWKDHPRLPRCGCWQSDYPVPPLPAFVARERPKEDDGKPGLAPRERLIERSLAAVRQKVFTHRLFAKEHGVSSDGTWGLDPNPREARKHGSSSFSFALCTAYELRHLLEDALWEQVREVAAFEADVCAQIEIRSGKYFDTAAEEAYPLNPLVLSAIFFGDHPHAAQWWDRVCDLEVSHLSAVQDHYDDRPIDGKPLRDRVLTENAHPDFTIENHGFLNPYYMHYFDPQIAYCKMAGRPIPRAFLWRRQQVWDWIKKNSGDDGFWMFPLGFDYYQHQYALLLRRISLMATVFGDPVAKLYECRAAQYLHQNWKRLGSPGCFYEPAGNGRDWELMCIAACYRLHQVFPSATWEALPPPDELLALRTGRTVFSYCRVVSHRTPEKYASFGFNHDLRIFTGNVVPQGGAFLNDPYLTPPMSMLDNLIGVAHVAERATTRRLVRFDAGELGESVFFIGVLAESGGVLGRQACFYSTPGRATLYFERLVARRDATLTEDIALPLAVENAGTNGNERTVTTSEGPLTVAGIGGDWRLIPLAGRWVNLDGRLSACYAGEVQPAYWDESEFVDPQVTHLRQSLDYQIQRGASAWHPGEKLLGGVFRGRRALRAGEVVAARGVCFYVGVSAEETPAFAQVFRYLEASDQVLRIHYFEPESGLVREVTADFDRLEVRDRASGRRLPGWKPGPASEAPTRALAAPGPSFHVDRAAHFNSFVRVPCCVPQELRATVKNPGPAARRCRLLLYAPEEWEVRGQRLVDLQIPAGGQAVHAFRVTLPDRGNYGFEMMVHAECDTGERWDVPVLWESDRRLACPRVKAFEPDGRLEHPAWSQAGLAADFLRTSGGRGLSPVQTEVRACHDGETLYLGFLCHEPDLAHVCRTGSANPFQDDSVEFFLDTGRRPDDIDQFMASLAGVCKVNRWNDARAVFFNTSPADKQCAVRVGEGPARWTLTMKIPLAEQGGPFRPGETWRCNFIRTRRAVPNPEFSSWVFFQRPIDDRTRFGVIDFVE